MRRWLAAVVVLLALLACGAWSWPLVQKRWFTVPAEVTNRVTGFTWRGNTKSGERVGLWEERDADGVLIGMMRYTESGSHGVNTYGLVHPDDGRAVRVQSRSVPGGMVVEARTEDTSLLHQGGIVRTGPPWFTEEEILQAVEGVEE